MAKFKFDRKALEKAARQATEELAERLSKLMAELALEFKGRPVEDIKPVLASRWKRAAGGPITDPELTQYAEEIAAGRPVVIVLDPSA